MRLHPTNMRKVPALAQRTHLTLPYCLFGHIPKNPLPALPWSCRNSSSPWALEANFQSPMSVLSFLELSGASIGEGELEGWEVSYPDRRLDAKLK